MSRPWTVLQARQRLRRVIAKAKPDVVITHSSWPHVVFAPVARQARVRLVYFAHGQLTTRHWLDRRAACIPPDLVLAHTPFTARSAGAVFPDVLLKEWLPPVARFEADELVRSQVRAELGAAEDAVVILQASRLERWKGQAAHLAALGLLRNVPGWVCWLAGGPQKAGEAQFLLELRMAAEQAGIADRVRFLGQRSDVRRLMAGADVYCQPNTDPEPFGLVFVEALYAGLPVVTSSVGGAAQIVDETCGVLTPSGDSAALATALQELLQNPLRRRALGKAGPGRAESLCNPDQVFSGLAGLLSALASPGVSRAAS
jgi:glycosyltransferase involved in cell wall biosynthesis